MTPGRAVLRAYNMAFMLDGRAGRAEFWWFFAFVGAGLVICAQMPRWVLEDAGDVPTDFLILLAVAVLVLIIPLLTAMCRRLHDSGHREGWILLLLVPVAGWIGLAILLMLQGSDGRNQFGDPPGSPGVR